MSHTGDIYALASSSGLDYSSSPDIIARMSYTKTDTTETKETDSYTIDPITHEPIHKDRAVFIYKQAYDANSLSDYIIYYYNKNELPTIPHTRQPFTEQILRNIYDKTSCLKLEIIIELINLLKCSKEIQKNLLSLEPEQRKILLNDYKIEILMKLSFDQLDIDYLLTEYNYLLNNDITEEIIKEAIQNNYRSLLFVPIDKMTEEIIKLAVQNDGCALEFVPGERMTRAEDAHICASSSGLDYTSSRAARMTDEICTLAVQNDGCALEYVPKDKMTRAGDALASSSGLDYTSSTAARMTDEIIKLAVQNDGCALEFVPGERMTDEIITLAVQKDYKSLRLVPIDKMTDEIIISAIRYCAHAFKFVPAEKMSDEICKLAVQNYGTLYYHIISQFK